MKSWKPVALTFLFASIVPLAAATAQMAQNAAPKAPKQFQVLHAADFAPDVVLPPPPAPGSNEEKAEVMAVHMLVDSASEARKAQARADADLEDPSIFDEAAGVKLKSLPATWALLKLVQNEGDRAADLSKIKFNRKRPFAVDPSLPNCDGSKLPTRSYPSGHSTLGYSVGLMLAELMPEKAPAIMARARDYALSRVICGVHFPSDTDASHTIGSIVTIRLLLDPAVADRIAAARAEVAQVK